MDLRAPQSTMTGQDEFIVEKVLKKGKGPHGETLYLIKWEGYQNKDNTWEPAENLSNDLIAAFKQQQKEKRMRKRMRTSRRRSASTEDVEMAGSDIYDGVGPVPEAILDAFLNEKGERVYLVKLRNIDEPARFPANVVQAKWQDLAIKFHEERFEWGDVTPNGPNSDTTSSSNSGGSSCVIM